MRGIVGRPTSVGHSLVEVNIYEGTFLLLYSILMGSEKGSKNINRYTLGRMASKTISRKLRVAICVHASCRSLGIYFVA